MVDNVFVSGALILFFLIKLCHADKDECQMWKCDGHKSSTSFNDYKNCSLSNPNWANTYQCTYCEIMDNGVCWCTSKGECKITDRLYFGLAMMALSALCTAIIWFKYCKKYKKMKKVKKLLIQHEEQADKLSRFKSPKTITKNEEGSEYNYDNYSSSDSEDMHIKTSSELQESLIEMKEEMGTVNKCTPMCFCIWITTFVCAAIFVLGTFAVIYSFF